MFRNVKSAILLRKSVTNLSCRFLIGRSYSTTDTDPRVAIVGGGPAGFYTAQQILKGHPKVQVDVYEKLPVPFGLVRFGVAPDHQEVKNVIKTFTQTASQERCHFIGNVSVGHDVELNELRNAYTAVVLAYGADDDKMLGIPGEQLQGVMSARAFVGWYNGLPQHRDLQPDLNTDTVVVLGQGNVAVDVARILLTPLHILKGTDITDYALAALSNSRVRRVHMVGRRGPLQAAFTTAELRDLVKLPGCRPVFNPSDFAGFQNHMTEIPRARKRMMELMIKTAFEPPTSENEKSLSSARNEWHLTFLRSPIRFNPCKKNPGRLESVQFAINRLEGPLGDNQKAIPTKQEEKLECGLVLRSIGYKSHRLDSATPFDDSSAIVPNCQGRVINHPGLYCSGWVKRGPIGVLASTMNDAFETGKVIVEDLKSGTLASAPTKDGGRDSILTLLQQRGIRTVSFAEWEKIDEIERCRGVGFGKPREKIVLIEEMLRVASGRR